MSNKLDVWSHPAPNAAGKQVTSYWIRAPDRWLSGLASLPWVPNSLVLAKTFLSSSEPG